MHLARLREEEMVTTEKSGRHVYYRIGDDRLADLVQYVCQRFSCQ
jgi:DNA-binding transcriptional ArsR family regulator